MSVNLTASDGLVARALARLRVPSVQAVTPTESDPLPSPEPTPAAPDVDTILSMPLPEFGTKHLALRIKLPDGSQCWFCSGAAEVAVLRGEDVPRREIWTAGELAGMLGAGWTRETIATLIAVKREFDGTVQPAPGPPGRTPHG